MRREDGRRKTAADTELKTLGSAHCPTPATQKHRSPRRTRGTPGRTSDPLAVHIVPRLPRKSDRSPSGTRGTPGRTSDPLVNTLPHACHAKAPEPKQHQRDARAYTRPLGSGDCPTPDTQSDRLAVEKGTPGRTSDPLAVHIVPRLPRKSDRSPSGTRGTPGRTSDPLAVHIPTPATQKRPDPKRHQRTPGRTSDPLAVNIVPRLPRKSDWSPRRTRGTPGRTSDPLAVRLPRKSDRSPSGTRGSVSECE